jgi:hypothetical protein
MFKGKSFFGIKYGSDEEEKKALFKAEEDAIKADFLVDGNGKAKPHGPPICFVFREEDSATKHILRNYGNGNLMKKEKHNPLQIAAILSSSNKAAHEYFENDLKYPKNGQTNDRFYSLSTKDTVVFRTCDMYPFLKFLNPKKWFSATCEAVAEDIQDETEGNSCCRDAQRKCSNVFSCIVEEKLHFVVVYPLYTFCCALAEREQYYVRLNSKALWKEHNESYVKQKAQGGKTLKKLGPLNSEVDEMKGDTDKPYRNIYSAFDRTNAKYQSLSTLDMLKLSLIEFESMDICYDEYPTFVTMFALHDDKEMAEFKHWWTFWDFPIQKIRDYYGEQLGFYFAFSCHSVYWYYEH